MVAPTKSPKKLQQLLGVKSTPAGHGRDPQEGHCSLAGRALLVRTILYDNKSIAEAARQFDVHPKTVWRWLKRVSEGESLDGQGE